MRETFGGANSLQAEELRRRATNRSLQLRLQKDDEASFDDREGGRMLELAVKNSRRLADPTETDARAVRDAVLLSTVDFCMNSVQKLLKQSYFATLREL